MNSLLHIDSSANRSSESVSRRLTALFADTWRNCHGVSRYRYRDLAAEPVPLLDTAYCTLGRRIEREGIVPPNRVAELAKTAAETEAWAETRPLIAEVSAADTIVIGAPMYNFSIPASLKAWIDRISFPGAFVKLETGEAALHDTRFVVIASRGGAYGPGTPREPDDFQIPYLRAYMARQGVLDKNLRFITAEMTLATVAPHLARFRAFAETSFAAAEVEVIAEATNCPGGAQPPRAVAVTRR